MRMSNRDWEYQMHKLHLSPEAIHDLEEIRDYIAEELQNPEAALKTIGDITKRLRMLQTHSQPGANLSTTTLMETGERFLVCGNYLAFYHVVLKVVYVDRILYNKRDYQSLLFPHEPKHQ